MRGHFFRNSWFLTEMDEERLLDLDNNNQLSIVDIQVKILETKVIGVRLYSLYNPLLVAPCGLHNGQTVLFLLHKSLNDPFSLPGPRCGWECILCLLQGPLPDSMEVSDQY